MKMKCLKHRESSILFISRDKEETKYVCEQCCIKKDKQQYKFELQKFIHIKNALLSPQYLVSTFNILPSLSEFFSDLDKYDDKILKSVLSDFQTKIANLTKALEAVYKEFQYHVKIALEMKDKISGELKKIIKYDQFQQFVVNLEQLGNIINPQAVEQNEKILHEYLQDLAKGDCQELNKKLIDMLDQVQLQPKDLNEEQYPQFKKTLRIILITYSQLIKF